MTKMNYFLLICVFIFALSTVNARPMILNSRNVTVVSKRQVNPNGFDGGNDNNGDDDKNDGVDNNNPVNDDNNNVNDFCANSNKDLADGTQNEDGSCSVTILGEIPDVNKMTSAIIVSPDNNERVNGPFAIDIRVSNLETGFFNDPVTGYYQLPQKLNNDGFIEGHTHVVVQKLSGPNPDNPPDARDFDFFLGVNNKADGSGLLTVQVDRKLSPGNYRICTMCSANSHQAVIMPVAQRGAQDDCIRIKVE